MNEIEIFTTGLGISTPWVIKNVVFNDEGDSKELHITIECTARTKFEYEDNDYSIYDHQNRTWRHLDFFNHRCYIHARVPRIKTEKGNVLIVEVPWASKGSSFALMFEFYVLNLIKGEMSVSGVGKQVEEHPGRIRRILKNHVMDALLTQELEDVKEMSLDETSSKKGHNYLTILSDREGKKVVGISEGKDAKAVMNALEEMEIRGADRSKVRSITMDMSVPFISAVKNNLPQSKIIFDRFHLTYNLNKAIDKIRRREQKNYSELKKTKYLWLKNFDNLDELQQQHITLLSGQYQNIGEAYRLKELFREIFDNATEDSKLKWLNIWMKDAWNTEIKEIQNFVNMLRTHWYGIKTYFQEVATNAFAERVNLKIQEIKKSSKRL